MGESINICTDRQLMSEVELNQHLIRVGDFVHTPTLEKTEVLDVFEGGFSAFSESTGREEDYYYTELQKGWSVAESTKHKHEQEDRFKYVSQ